MFYRFHVESIAGRKLSETGLSKYDAIVSSSSGTIVGLNLSACLTCGSVILKSCEDSHVCAVRNRPRQRRHSVKVDGDSWTCVDCGASFSKRPLDDMVCSGPGNRRRGV